MNVERLHLILKETSKAIQAARLIEMVEALRGALQNLVNDPAPPSHQQQVSKALNELRQRLPNIETSKFPPPWRDVLYELDIGYFLGDELLKKIEETLARNQITPSLAFDEINQIHAQLVSGNKAITQSLNSFSRFKIEEEKLRPGEAEVGVLFPRESVDNELSKFTKELQDVAWIVKTFEELTTGQRRDPQIRSLASSDLSVLLDIWPVAGAALAAAIERTAAFYKQVLEIKKLKAEIRRLQLSDEIAGQLDAEANEKMEISLKELHKEILATYEGNKNRQNELANELTIVLNKIANKIDRGVHFEFRAGEPLAKEGDGEESEDVKTLRGHTVAINEAGRRLLFERTAAEQILKLPEASGKSSDGKGRAVPS
jgi:hypothetical protein